VTWTMIVQSSLFFIEKTLNNKSTFTHRSGPFRAGFRIENFHEYLIICPNPEYITGVECEASPIPASGENKNASLLVNHCASFPLLHLGLLTSSDPVISLL
jgi:hypothetical protein